MARLPVQWQKLPVSLAELCIDTTLRCGQSFRWRKFDDEWRCALHGRIIALRQDAECLYFKAVFPEAKPATAEAPDDTAALLRSYFNLQLDLGRLYAQWSRDDANFRKKAPQFSGIRILNQSAWEALVCFICSSNNNIARISQMAHKLCLHYGPLLGTLEGEPYHDFPTPSVLAAPSVESQLRQLGFGYRAKYIAQTAQMLCSEKPPGWLARLRNIECPSWPDEVDDALTGLDANPDAARDDGATRPPRSYRHAHEQLLLLSGVGPKVADCVCLMGLGWGEAVPVDTHVWQIAVRDYKFKKTAAKTFSKVLYDAVGDHFRRLWGTQAGWAQSVLFTANLRAFSDRLKPDGKGAAEAVEDTESVKQEAGDDGEARAVTSTRRKRKTAVKVESVAEQDGGDGEDREDGEDARAVPKGVKMTRAARAARAAGAAAPEATGASGATAAKRRRRA